MLDGGRPGAAAAAGPPAASELPGPLVGRLRRWHHRGEWGFVYSELHQSDVFLDGADARGELSEGDLVLFEVFAEEDGELSARECRRAMAWEVEQRQKALEPYYARHSAGARRHSQQEALEPPAAPPGAAPAMEQRGGGAPAAGAPRGGACPQLPAGAAAPAAAGAAAADGLMQAPMGAGPPRAMSGRQLAAAAAVGASATGQPPPPPAHPAPSGPVSFPPQAAAAMAQQPQQQAYMVPAQQGPPQSYPAYGMDGRAPQPQYRQGPPAAMARQVPAAGSPDTLMLEPPPVFERLDSKGIAAMLKGASRVVRAQTFRSRGGSVAQVSQEFHAVLTAARQAAAQAGEDLEAPDAGSQGHRLQGQQPQSQQQPQQQHQLQPQQQVPVQPQQGQQHGWDQAWMWPASGVADMGGHGQGGGDGYGGMGPGPAPPMAGHRHGHGVGGDLNVYQATRAG